jgi:hypothetical protein
VTLSRFHSCVSRLKARQKRYRHRRACPGEALILHYVSEILSSFPATAGLAPVER